MAESVTELKLEVEKAGPTRVPSETRTIRLKAGPTRVPSETRTIRLKAEPTRVPSETRTIRLEGDVFPKLEALAEQEDVSISFIINKALRRHVEWQIYAEKFGFMMA